VLIRTAAAVVVALAVAACASASPPGTPRPPVEPVVTAMWVADDGSVAALNVVLPRTIMPRGLAPIAERYRRDHPDARVIVRFFPPTAGRERFVVGYVPTDGSRLPATRDPAAVATFDFPAPTSSTTTDGR